MSEENQTTEGAEPETNEQDTSDRDRIESAKRGLIKELSAVKAQLAEKAAAERQREEAELEAQGKLKELLDKAKAELEATRGELEDTRTNYKIEQTKAQLDRALEREGVANDYTRKGILGDYLAFEEQPEIDDFISSLKDTTPDIFVALQPPPAGAGAKNKPVGVATQSGQLTEEKLDQMFKSADPEERKLAYEQFKRQHGLPADKRY